MSIIDENTKKMVDDNAKKSIEEAETYIVATNKSLTLKGTKPEAMAVVSIMLKRLIEDKIIDDMDLDFIIKAVKKRITADKESLRDALDRITDEMIENLFKD